MSTHTALLLAQPSDGWETVEDKVEDGVALRSYKNTDGSTTPFAYLFNPAKFKPARARKWLDEHMISVYSFHAAAEYAFATDEQPIEKWVEMWSQGRWRPLGSEEPVEVSMDMIRDAATNINDLYRAEKVTVYAKLTHEKDPYGDLARELFANSPYPMGIVTKAEVRDKSLWGFHQMPVQFARAVRAGFVRDRSIEVWPELYGRSHVVDAVAWYKNTEVAVAGMAPVQWAKQFAAEGDDEDFGSIDLPLKQSFAARIIVPEGYSRAKESPLPDDSKGNNPEGSQMDKETLARLEALETDSAQTKEKYAKLETSYADLEKNFREDMASQLVSYANDGRMKLDEANRLTNLLSELPLEKAREQFASVRESLPARKVENTEIPESRRASAGVPEVSTDQMRFESLTLKVATSGEKIRTRARDRGDIENMPLPAGIGESQLIAYCKLVQSKNPGMSFADAALVAEEEKPELIPMYMDEHKLSLSLKEA